ncbi:nicotinate (nicotinamide) nucleotide adenylyltransferase [Alteromonas sp. ASW11-19]|uniref:Probable nicotinate-nucleotide adenylyltransferase n=1 Tax=Alteromonas salexigens TaxID=2982530 RepID=A0ABT2VLZ5_9ALTE|nr:nicotinate (nicotinamide) nucleotide adenylyltransferase [Alteromonas salexigens]MCU7554332.1 nicotinate (nicotinamide) nucleotide adenylyltransferase [Alteromonas salexigens]
MSNTPLALLGGTFNPPHTGHIEPALAAVEELGIARLGLMPCRIPPHKDTAGIAQQHRINMVNAVCAGHPTLYPELIELSLPPPSYTVNTLRALRKAHPNNALCFLIGDDSLYNLSKWYEWEALLDYCHLIIMRRNVDQDTLSPEIEAFTVQHRTTHPEVIRETTRGHVYFASTPLQNISSTSLRNQIARAGTVNLPAISRWLAPSVADYIEQHQLYVPTT